MIYTKRENQDDIDISLISPRYINDMIFQIWDVVYFDNDILVIYRNILLIYRHVRDISLIYCGYIWIYRVIFVLKWNII